MLVCAGQKDKFNMMTASWGGIGWLWNRPVVFVFVRPERYTHEFIEREGRFTLSFFKDEWKDALKFCMGSFAYRGVSRSDSIMSEGGEYLRRGRRRTILGSWHA